MPNIFRNVAGAGTFGVTTQLLAPGDTRGRKLKSIYFSNARNSVDAGALIEVFIQNINDTGKNPETYYLLRNFVLPPGSGMILDEQGVIGFDLSKFGLFVQCTSASDAIDVIISF